MAAKNHLQPGVEVGGYRIEVPLGEGGMATVYRAIQMSLNRPVALKVLHQKYSERDDFLARFERESGALAQAQHPNIVSVIDRGAFDGNYYFVMEFVDGSDLDVLLSRYEFTLKQIMQIINEVGKGLSYVHSLEMVHRDMKPANILIGKQGVIKVSDFGIAQIAQGTGGDQGLTDEGAAMGTGVYMAPEQMSDARNVDHRADVYALGATFYKLLTRRLPAGSFAMPSHLRPEVPAKVDGVIRKALDPDRDCRQQTVKQLCREMILALKNRNLDASSASAGIEGQTSAVAISKLHRAEDSAQSSPENEMPSAFRGLKPVVTTDSASGKKKKKKKKKKGSGVSPKVIAAGGIGVVILAAVLFIFLNKGDGDDQVASGAPAAEQPTPQPSQESSPVPEEASPPAAEAPDPEVERELAQEQGVSPDQIPVPTEPGDALEVALAETTPTPTPTPSLTPPPTPTPIPTPPPGMKGTDGMIRVRRAVSQTGSDASLLSGPTQRQMVTSFFIDKAEVSNGAWYEFVRLAGGRAPDYWQGNRPPSNMMQMPVHAISWYEAQQYAAWIGKRLPTELEWEFAVAGGIANESPPRTYPWGNRFKEILRNPNDVQLYAVSENRGDVTPDGILNAAGNVAEWTTSGFANYDGALIQHPDAGSDFRVIRGAGELDFALHNLPPHRLQQTHQRWYASPKARIPGVGFRCALDAVLGISN